MSKDSYRDTKTVQESLADIKNADITASVMLQGEEYDTRPHCVEHHAECGTEGLNLMSLPGDEEGLK